MVNKKNQKSPYQRELLMYVLEATIDFSPAIVTDERGIFNECVFIHMIESGFVEI